MRLWHGDPVRRHSIAMTVAGLAGTVFLLLTLTLRGVIALWDWLGNVVPAVSELIRTYAPAALQRIDTMLPGTADLLERWLHHRVTTGR